MNARSNIISALLIGIALGAATAIAAPVQTNYPEESLAAGEQGRVGFTVDITENGRATKCRVTESSGYPRLDKSTCELVEMNARFKPATDGKGNPTTGTYSGHVNWVIDDKSKIASDKPVQ